jgi:hypothetical protein
MRRIPTMVGAVYIALFLTWSIVLVRLLREPHFSIPKATVVSWFATPAICLLTSHWFVRRGCFAAASLPLMFWLYLLFTGYVSIPICGNT